MASGATRQVLIRFMGDTKDLDQAAGRGEQSMSAWGKTTSKVLGTIGGLFAAQQIGQFFKEGVTGAANLEQSMGAVDSVFKDSAQQIHAWAESAATDVGLSENAYREMSATVGAQLKNMGVAQQDVAAQSGDLITKGADLAAMFGGPTSEAVAALGSLLRGETDPIERYGISIKQADINAQLAAMGLEGLEGEAAKTARTQALLTLVNEQGADAWGTFADETGTASGQAQIAQAQWENMQTTLGEALLPVLTELGTFANETLIPALQGMADWVGENSDVIGPMAKVAGGAALAVGGLALAVKGVQVARGIANTALTPFATGLDRVDARAPGAARGVRSFGRALGRLSLGVAGVLTVGPQLNNWLKEQSDLFGASADEARRYYEVLTAGTQGDTAEQIRLIKDELKELDEITDEAPDSELFGTRIFWTDWSGEAQTAADKADYLRSQLAELEHQQEVANAETEAGAAATEEGTAATEDSTAAVDAKTEALDELIDKLDEASGRVLSQRDAERQLEEAYDAATQAIEDNGAGLDVTTEAGRANQSALDDVAQAALDQASANLEAGASMKSVRADMKNARGEFIRTAVQMGLTEEEARQLANRLGLIPGNYQADITANDQATSVIDRVDEQLGILDGQTAEVTLTTVQRTIREIWTSHSSGIPERLLPRASGGPMFPGWALVGEEGPELVRFGSAGTVTPHEESMGLLRQQANAGGGDVVVNVDISRREIEGIAEVTVERNGKRVKRAVKAGTRRTAG